MNDKPQFTEAELDEIDQLHHNFGKESCFHEVITFLKEKFGWSEVHNVITELRKEFPNKRFQETKAKFNEKYKDSTLIQTLRERMDWNKANKVKN